MAALPLSVPQVAAKPSRRWPALLALWAPAVLMVLGGGYFLARAALDQVYTEVRSGGLVLHLDRAIWLHDQMEHSQRFPMPSLMMPGMPERGFQRYSIEVTVRNLSAKPEIFCPHEIELHAEDGGLWPPMGGEVGDTTIAPGHQLTSTLHYDVPETSPELRLVWARAEVAMARALPPEHPEKALDEPVSAWPEEAEKLPAGDPVRGQQLYIGEFSCISCHGLPGAAGSNTVGPALGDLSQALTARASSASVAQHVYDSVLYPDLEIAPLCANEKPCEKPSKMPFYGDLLSLQKMADIIAFLQQPQP
jgi:mono/diheme cytochrome c family protein